MYADIRVEGINLSETIDFVIVWESQEQQFIVDIFNTKEPDSEKAYLESFSYDDLDSALSDARQYIYK